MDIRLPTAHLTLLCALAFAPAPLAAKASAPTIEQATQAYVQGRLAMAGDDYVVAAERFGTALKGDRDEIARRRSLDVAMLSGDMKAALRLANQIPLAAESTAASAVGDSIVALTRAAGAAAARDWRGYEAARAAFGAPGRGGESGQVLGVLLEAWGRAARGDIDGALALVDPAAGRGAAASYLREHRAHLLAYGKRWPEAADAYAAIVGAEGANVTRLRLSAVGTALEAAATDPKYRERAILLLGGGPERDPQLIEARERLGKDARMSGRKLADLVDSPQEGLALMFLRLAADLARERAVGPAINFARLATLADPALPDGWLVASDTLARAGKYDQALAALDSVPKGGGWRQIAETRRAGILIAAERDDEAREILRRYASRPDATADDWSRLAELERRQERSAEAIAAYDEALKRLPADSAPAEAQLAFLRGTVKEKAGDWPGAETDLRRAVELADKNPIYLNYLGYSLIDRGLRIEEARGLIAQAYAISPENGAIVDSMGWAEYLTGNYPEAVRLLETARGAEPSDPTVADHLGDALWKVGRRIEARHAWASAAALSPEPKLAEMIRKKLDYGLDVALASR
ncbi:tetratricopeptide repeat protein [Sandaracinobacter sp. RS1-74]|uniref:tetratricopeptide repeat protein n=1 Tax=Sandaracinobacteroides sayramensis TaxID=2913411 RepID=UPI001EDAB4D7|nr:tetratricopeptide repeat protein [Sandaracinobacteroides sayramensis]MCG2839916.1 tetratricopeptide repeat protein [Sandaracinobacteroides sayramensis]